MLISHGHPDRYADLNPLLRARPLRDEPTRRTRQGFGHSGFVRGEIPVMYLQSR